MNIVGVQSYQMEGVWPHVKDYFQSFEDRSKGEISAGELLHQVIKRERQCWIALDGKEVKACALTEVQGGALKTVVLGFCAGKDMQEWYREMVDEIERWAAHMGSKRVRCIPRLGWEPSLKGLGYKKTHLLMDKDIGAKTSGSDGPNV